MSEANIYTTGGTVQAGSGIYIRRRTDDELLELCRRGEFAYVLTPRQLGKSSLMIDTSRRLADEGIHSGIVDLSLLGTDATPEQWYLGVLTTIEAELSLKNDVTEWWQSQGHLGFTQRLTLFFESVLLEEVEGPVVIFVDEIDTTLNLSFRADFFAAIRYFYNARAHTPGLRRLSFVIIGVATPGDLIDDPRRTPFNIGRWVFLSDFNNAEASPLAAGLGLPDEDARRVLRWVLQWTGGHPYLTQRLCQVIAARRRGSWSKSDVKAAVADTFLGERSKEDANLQFVRDMLTQRVPNGVDRNELLRTYRTIRRWGSVADDEHSLVKSHLKLSGVVRREGKVLRVRNRIYRSAFDGAWVRDHLSVNWKRLMYRTAAALVGLVIFSLIPLSAVAINRAIVAERALASAEAATQREKAARQEVINALRSEQEAKSALEAALSREQEGKKQVEQSLERETLAKQEAQVQRTAAEEQRRRAEQKSEEADKQRREAEKLRQVARSREVAASASSQSRQNPELGVLLAREAVQISDTAQAKDSLRDAMLDFRLRTTLAAHGKPVGSASYSPDGRLIVTASDDNTARVWDVAGGRVLYTLQHRGVVRSAVFSPDGKMIATASDDTNASLWDASDGKNLFVLDGHMRGVATAAFSPDSKLLVTTSRDNTAGVWNTSSGKCVFVLDTSGKEQAALPQPDGKCVFAFAKPSASPTPTGGAEDAAELNRSTEGIDPIANRRLEALPIVGPVGRDPLLLSHLTPGVFSDSLTDDDDSEPRKRELPATNAGFSRDGSRILTKDSDAQEVRVWDVATHALIFTLEGIPTQLPPSVESHPYFLSETYSPNGKFILTFDSNAGREHRRMVTLWDAQTGGRLFYLTDFSESDFMPVFSPNSSLVVTVGRSNTAMVWDVDARQVSFVLQGHSSPIRSAAFSPDGRLIVTTDDTATARVWDARDGRALYVLQGHAKTVLDASFSPDGLHVVTASADNTARVWDVATEPESTPLQAFGSGVVEGSVFSPDGLFVMSYSKYGNVQVSEVSTGREQYRLSVEASAPLTPLFSPDGRYIVAGGDNNTARVWRASDGQEAAVLRGHTGRILSASFSRDGSLLVTTSEDTTARIWDAETWRPLQTLTGHKGEVRSADISPGKNYVVTASDDNTARVWDTATGRQLAAFLHPSRVLTAAVNPDGEFIVTGDARGSTYVWDASTHKNLNLLEGAYLLGYKPAFSSDGRRMVTLGPDNIAFVWDVSSGRRLAVLQGHTGDISSFVFAADDEVVVTTSDDGSARVWDSTTGRGLAVFGVGGAVEADDNDRVLAGFFQSGSRKLITSTDAATLRTFPCEICMPTGNILGLVGSRVTRDLSAGERETYLHTGVER